MSVGGGRTDRGTGGGVPRREADPRGGSLTSFLGVDVGTGRCKALLLDADGSVRRVARRPTPLHRSSEGVSLDADELLATVLGTIRDCLGDLGAEVAAVGVASMAESGVPLDADGSPLAEIVAWSDRRSASEADELANEVGARRLFGITGVRPDAKYTLPKLLWLRRHRAGPMRRLNTWAGIADLVVQRLTGALGTDPSLACRTLAFDVSRRHWDAELLRRAGIAVEQMSAVVAPGSAVGEVNGRGASLSGLSLGTPVAVAGHDHLVGAFGAGVRVPRHVADSMGTAEVAILLLDDPILTDAAFDAGLTCGVAAGSGRSYLLGNLPSAGGLLEWLAGTVAGDASTESVVRIPSGIVARPFIGGEGSPAPDASTAASLAGLRAEHGLADLRLALVEGASYQLRSIVEALERVAGQRVADVTLFGGGARDPSWVATKVNVNRWPTRLAASSEATAVGAAMIGAVAAGRDMPAVPPATDVATDLHLATAYDELYRTRYLPLVSASYWSGTETVG